MSAQPESNEPYAYVTRRQNGFQLYIPSTHGMFGFEHAQEVTRFITSHLPGKPVLWDI